MAHQIVMNDNGQKCCTFCGSSGGFEDACKFSTEKAKIDMEKAKIDVENKKIEVENRKIEVENRKVMQGTVLNSLVFFISFIFVAVIYLGLDGVKMQFSRMVDKCSKGLYFSPLW